MDDDVARLLERLRDRRKEPFRKVVNDALRAGLTALSASPPRRPTYRLQPVSLGRPSLPDLDDVAEVLAISEGEDHL